MDNRLKFLYYSMTELWGRREEGMCRGWKARCKRSTRAAGKTAEQKGRA